MRRFDEREYHSISMDMYEFLERYNADALHKIEVYANSQNINYLLELEAKKVGWIGYHDLYFEEFILGEEYVLIGTKITEEQWIRRRYKDNINVINKIDDCIFTEDIVDLAKQLGLENDGDLIAFYGKSLNGHNNSVMTKQDILTVFNKKFLSSFRKYLTDFGHNFGMKKEKATNITINVTIKDDKPYVISDYGYLDMYFDYCKDSTDIEINENINIPYSELIKCVEKDKEYLVFAYKDNFSKENIRQVWKLI